MRILRRAHAWCLSALALGLSCACGAVGADFEPQAPGGDAGLRAGAFVDMAEYLLQTHHTSAAAGHLERRLGRAFDDICVDTFCEGDYGNLTPLSWRCSVNAATGSVGQCVWVFAGSAESVDAASGKVQVQSKLTTCEVPVTGTASELLQALLDDPDDDAPILDRPLPGGAAVYHVLSRCL